MLGNEAKTITPFENKVWLSSPTMHGDELKYVTEAYETNWMSTVGKISMKLRSLLLRKLAVNMRWHYRQGPQQFIWL